MVIKLLKMKAEAEKIYAYFDALQKKYMGHFLERLPEWGKDTLCVIEELKKSEPELASCCVPECVYRGFCPEFKSCGFVNSPLFAKMVEEYRKV